METRERERAVSGQVTDEDVVRVAAGCRLHCVFCPHAYGRSGDPIPKVLDPDYPIPAAHRITILAGDCADARFASLVRRAREAGASEVRVYAHAGLADADDLPRLRDAGLTGLLLVLPAARKDLLRTLTGAAGSLARTANAIRVANRVGLAISLEVPVVARSVAFVADTVRRVLNLVENPDAISVRFLAEFDAVQGPVAWDPRAAREAVAEAIEVARAHRVPFALAHPEAPPPCLLDLSGVVPEVYPSLAASHPASARKPFQACRTCKVAAICAADGRYLQASAGRPRPVRAQAPVRADETRSSTLFLRRASLETLLEEFRRRGPVCRYPWEALEAHDIRGVVAPCAGGWPKAEAVQGLGSWRELGLIEAWNAPGMQAFRRAIGSGDPRRTCKPECPAFHGGPQSALPPPRPGATRVFHENFERNLREMLDGAEVLRSRPLAISLSPTFRCPNRCRMCDIHEMRDRMGNGPELMDLDDALAEELKDLLPTTRLLALTGGEPLVSRRLRDLLRCFDADRFPDGAVSLTTNGLLLREPMLRDFARTRWRLIIVSLNAATEETYEAITNTRGGFPRVIANLRRLIAQAPRMAGRPAVLASFVVMRSNLHELGAFLDLVAGLGCGARLLPIERNRCGESVFTDEQSLRRALEVVEHEVQPRLSGRPYAIREEVARLASILRSRWDRRVFEPL